MREIEKLNTTGTEVTLHKVKAHAGIKGNEEADRIARTACEKGEQREPHNNKEVIKLKIILHQNTENAKEIKGKRGVYEEVEKQIRASKRRENNRMQKLTRQLEGSPQEWRVTEAHKSQETEEGNGSKKRKREEECTEQVKEEELKEMMEDMQEQEKQNGEKRQKREEGKEWWEGEGWKLDGPDDEYGEWTEENEEEIQQTNRKRNERQEKEQTRIKRIKIAQAEQPEEYMKHLIGDKAIDDMSNGFWKTGSHQEIRTVLKSRYKIKPFDAAGSDNTFYSVREIKAERVRGNTTQWLIGWEGFTDKDDTWEPIEHLAGHERDIRAFREQQKEKNGKCMAEEAARKKQRKEDNDRSVAESDGFEDAFGGKRRSPVWQHYRIQKDEQSGKILLVKCLHCPAENKAMAYCGNTTNLRAHLSSNRDEYCKLLVAEGHSTASGGENNDDSSSNPTQNTIEALVPQTSSLAA
ncbi:hypothetical protein CYMTET_7398 [Cymbomonas tetramitiformis]|uniref:Chromo domain-containing protein n=1 Tax=Cymbomonas tetramitiformis TaxID=36881 RepID=A0AAE0GV26_9CHLO|nr:hypothetical protein CYMTET_7398 [Cymbomonas tetramitiformis]